MMVNSALYMLRISVERHIILMKELGTIGIKSQGNHVD